MLTRPFGPQKVRLPILGLGCSRIGSFNNPASTRDTMVLLEQALDWGVTLLDTADIYGQGDSERTIGRLLRQRRGAAFVVSKVGKRFSTKMRVMRPLKPLLKPLLARSGAARQGITARRDGAMASDFSPGHVAAAIDSSLRRLRFDHLDAVLLHSPAAAELADPALPEALRAAQRAGKVGWFGVACDDLPSLEAALTIPGVSLVEIPPDLLDAGRPLLLNARQERGLGVLVREVIRFRGELSPLEAVTAMTRRPDVTTVITGTGSVAHLDELVRTVSATADDAGPARSPSLRLVPAGPP